MSDQAVPATREHPFNPLTLGHDYFEGSPQPLVAVEGPTHVVRYSNPAFARLVGKNIEVLVGRPFAEAVPEVGSGCLALLGRVFGTGVPENLAEQEHPSSPPAYWSYAAWAILGGDGLPAGVMLQVTDSTETARFRQQAAAMNESLLLSSVRQHELAEAAEALNAQLRDARDRLEERVAERTAQLAAANALLRSEIEAREAAESDRRELLRRLGTAQEEERLRIARDFHDSAGQLLTGLALAVEAVSTAGALAPAAAGKLAEARRLANELGKELHGVAVRLRPTALDDVGLEAALGQLVGDWSARSGVTADFQAVGLGTGRLPWDVETALYRVVQEALTNVGRHARAAGVSVTLTRVGGDVVAVVEDDGGGFDPDVVPRGRLGLIGMRERVNLTGGQLDVESAPGSGTTVIARVPLTAAGGEGRPG